MCDGSGTSCLEGPFDFSISCFVRSREARRSLLVRVGGKPTESQFDECRKGRVEAKAAGPDEKFSQDFRSYLRKHGTYDSKDIRIISNPVLIYIYPNLNQND